jgi:hypothetical protein
MDLTHYKGDATHGVSGMPSARHELRAARGVTLTRDDDRPVSRELQRANGRLVERELAVVFAHGRSFQQWAGQCERAV